MARIATAATARETEQDCSGPVDDEPVVALHPSMASLYQEKVADLMASLSDSEIRLEAADTLRSLIDRVVLVPNPSAPDRHDVDVQGALATVLALGEAQAGIEAGQVWLVLVL